MYGLNLYLKIFSYILLDPFTSALIFAQPSASIPSNFTGRYVGPDKSSNLSAGGLNCRSMFGPITDVTSCWNAWERIPQSSNRQPFVPRNSRGIGISVPRRYQSEDGLCVIDLQFPSRLPSIGSGDFASWNNIVLAAGDIIDTCSSADRSGGTVSSLGGFFDLFPVAFAVSEFHCIRHCARDLVSMLRM